MTATALNSFKSVKCSSTDRATVPQRHRNERHTWRNTRMTSCTHNPTQPHNFSMHFNCTKWQKSVNQWRMKRGRANLISFGVSSSSYFFFSFFRKTSQMINMTMRTPRDIPTIAPATIPTSLTSVKGKEEVMRFTLTRHILIWSCHS